MAIKAQYVNGKLVQEVINSNTLTTKELNTLLQEEFLTETESVEVKEVKTRKELIESLGYASITEDFVSALETGRKKRKDMKAYIKNTPYFGVYANETTVIINSAYDTNFKYIRDAVKEITGKKLIILSELVRKENELWEIYKKLDQYKDGGEA